MKGLVVVFAHALACAAGVWFGFFLSSKGSQKEMIVLLILLVFILGVYTGGKVNQWKHEAEDASMIKRIEDGCLDAEVAHRISEALDGTETIPRPRFHR